MSIYRALAEVAAERGDATAITFEGEDISYRQMMAQIDLCAANLERLGIGRGRAFAVQAQNRPETVFALVAAARLGAIFVPMHFRLTAREVDHIVSNGEVGIIFSDDEARCASPQERAGCAILPIGELTRAMATDGAESAREPVSPDDDLMIVYTSGSTGVPKAVVIGHAAQIAAARSFREMWGLSASDVTVAVSPFGFLLGLSTSTLLSLLNGMRVVILRRFHPEEALKALAACRATIFNAVPTMYAMMADYAAENGVETDLSCLRAAICSGAPLSPPLRARVEATLGIHVQDYFGMTEAYPLAGRYAADSLPYPAGAVGRVAPGAQLRFVDEAGRDCPQGEPGEMLARGPSMLTRYHKDPGLNARALRDGWFRTGDIGLTDAQGFVHIVGRLKELIIRGGNNIAPSEIESALNRHPHVRLSAVFGVPDEVQGEIPVAAVVSGGEVTQEELLSFVAADLAKFKVPARICFVDAMPLGPTGKTDKKALRQDFLSMTAKEHGDDAGSGTLRGDR